MEFLARAYEEFLRNPYFKAAEWFIWTVIVAVLIATVAESIKLLWRHVRNAKQSNT